MQQIFNKTAEKTKRKNLRNSLNKAEIILWLRLKGKKVAGCKFRRQESIGAYVVDFYAPEYRFAVEVDGITDFLDDESIRKDSVRQKFIESFGVTVIRFTNSEIYYSLDFVVEKIEEEIKKLKSRFKK
jgi:very-short-patch-repair endonuclease